MIYYCILRYKATGNSRRYDFASEQARALAIVALGDYITVIDEGETPSKHFNHDDATGLQDAR